VSSILEGERNIIALEGENDTEDVGAEPDRLSSLEIVGEDQFLESPTTDLRRARSVDEQSAEPDLGLGVTVGVLQRDTEGRKGGRSLISKYESHSGIEARVCPWNGSSVKVRKVSWRKVLERLSEYELGMGSVRSQRKEYDSSWGTWKAVREPLVSS
jgi:hypothetical protein